MTLEILVLSALGAFVPAAVGTGHGISRGYAVCGPMIRMCRARVAEAAETFAAIFGRAPDEDDGDAGCLWSHCCAAVD